MLRASLADLCMSSCVFSRVGGYSNGWAGEGVDLLKYSDRVWKYNVFLYKLRPFLHIYRLWMTLFVEVGDRDIQSFSKHSSFRRQPRKLQLAAASPRKGLGKADMVFLA